MESEKLCDCVPAIDAELVAERLAERGGGFLSHASAVMWGVAGVLAVGRDVTQLDIATIQ